MGGMSGEVSRRFASIHGHAISLGVTSSEMVGLPALVRASERRSRRGWCGALSGCVQAMPLFIALLSLTLAAALTGVLVYVQYFDGLQPTLQFWVEDLEEGVLAEEKCLVPVHDIIKDFIRPPVQCNFCVNVSGADVVSKLSRDMFEERYAYSGRPLVVTDAMDDWSALYTFNFDYFKSLYASDSPALSDSGSNEDCQFFPYQTEFSNLSEVLGMSPQRYAQPWYIGWSNCDSHVANVLRRHYRKPYFLPEVSESSKLDWIFMGRPGLGAYMHIDSVDNPSWQAQVRGTKTWTLEPPPECYFACPHSAGGVEVTVRPGEIIVLDTNIWYHKTEVAGPEISVVIGSEYD